MLYFYEWLSRYQISKKEQIYLFNRWKQHNCQESKTKLIMSFMPMALKVAKDVAERLPSVEIDDLFQESYIIINNLLEKYNPQRADLSTFLYIMLKKHLKEYCARQIVPVKMSSKVRRRYKQLGISLNPVYLSELRQLEEENRSATTTDEEGDL